jgi:spermidine synthase
MLSTGIAGIFMHQEKCRFRWAALITTGLLSACLALSTFLDHRTTRMNHPNLVVSRDSPYSRITITERAGQFVVYENDALGFESQNTASEEFVHLAAVHHERPERILILGGGVEGIVEQALRHHPRRIDYVELNKVLLNLVQSHLPREFSAALRSEKVSIICQDPRDFLQTADDYDVIITAMPEPFSGRSNRFYTREYFQLCAACLRPQGVFACRLPSLENIWTESLTYRNASILKGLSAVFKDVLVLPGATNTILASHRALSRDPGRLARRLEVRGIESRVIPSAYMAYLYTNDRFFEINRRMLSIKAPENTDNRPICYPYSSMIWISKFIRQMIHWDVSFLHDAHRWPGLFFLWGFFLLCALCVVAFRRVRFRRVLLAGAVGFIGMMLETILILYYQSKNGVLFQNIGLLFMMFMGGLAAGAVSVDKAICGRCTVLGGDGRYFGRRLVLGLTALNLGLALLLYFNPGFGIFSCSFFLFASGYFVAGVFGYASLAGVEDQKGLVSPLYAADLMGGCAASILGGIALIPFLGFLPSALFLAGLAIVALLLV